MKYTVFLQKSAHIRGSVPNINKSLNGCFCLGGLKFFFWSAQHVESIHFTRWCDDCGILFSVEENSQRIHPPNKSHCLFKIPGVVRGHVVCRVRVSQRASYLQFRSWCQKSSNGQLGSEIVFLTPSEFVWDGPINSKQGLHMPSWS